jgi:hypothetical protein
MTVVSLSGSANHIDNLYPNYTYNHTSNVSLMNSANIVGLNCAFPDSGFPRGNYSQSYLNGYTTGPSGARETLEMARVMKSGQTNTDEALCNSYIVTYAGNYIVRAFKNSTQVYKNGSLAGTLTTAKSSTLSLVSLAVDDVITGLNPIVLSNTTYPGMQGIYTGYAGYAFSTRRDRATLTFRVFNISAEDCRYTIRYTTTSDSNVTSTTLAQEGTITSGGSISYATATTANYYIQTDGLCVAHVGQAPSNDVRMLYPMTEAMLYGFFSQDGHTFATNNPEAARQNSGGGYEIYGRSTDATSALIASPSTGNNNFYASDGVATTIKGGAYFSGDACTLFLNGFVGMTPNAASTRTLMAAESQADGNGSEMTTFTSTPAHGRACLFNNFAAWVAFVGEGYSGSAPSPGNYGDVIMRFNSSNALQASSGFTGQNTTSQPNKKAYFGNGSGTGTYASAGDWFYCTVAVQGYHDAGSSLKDEANCIMTNDVDLPSLGSSSDFYFPYGGGTEEGYENCDLACEGEHDPGSNNFTMYFISQGTFPTVGDVCFSTNALDTPFNGQDIYWYLSAKGAEYCIQIGYEGIVKAVTTC